MSLDFAFSLFFFPFSLAPRGALPFALTLPLLPPPAGNSSECPPPGNALDDTVCVDMGKCKDGECVPFCEREKNLRSCACNGGWRGAGPKGPGSAPRVELGKNPLGSHIYGTSETSDKKKIWCLSCWFSRARVFCLEKSFFVWKT